MNRQCDFSAVWSDLGKINDAHKRNVSADGLERVLIGRIAFD